MFRVNISQAERLAELRKENAQLRAELERYKRACASYMPGAKPVFPKRLPVAEARGDCCPECGRAKAHSTQDMIDGKCPKWYAIRDSEASDDCKATAEKAKAKEPKP